MSSKYEGVVGSYSFMMVDANEIEVWGESDNDNPESFIFIKEGSIQTQKDFDTEISFWYLDNVK
jgi:hypothetical protein|tara:strand:- start:17867 stop:18058 length:192 start_codon:yes stop_codon:yes gene_type:complete